MALDTNDWRELYEGAREVFGPTRAAIFMKAMESGMRDDLATKTDLANLRAEFGELRGDFGALRGDLESKLRTQTWAIVAAFVGIGGLTVTLAHLG